MELKEAVETLKFLVESEDEKEALLTLVKLAKSNSDKNNSENASYRQINFINRMASAADVDAKEEIEGLGIDVPDDIRQMPKKDASKVIKEFISRGYKDKIV